jgi:hypothetical protein
MRVRAMARKLLIFGAGAALLGVIAVHSYVHLRYFTAGDRFSVAHEGAVLPVWVRGNTTSGKFIIYLHGGPGASGIAVALAGFLRELEGRYGLVYLGPAQLGTRQGGA